MRNWKFLFYLFAISSFGIMSCNNDDEPMTGDALSVNSVEAKGTSFQDGSDVTSDLNGASSAIDVALNASITIDFNKAVDASTVSTSTVKLSDGTNDVGIAVNASGSSITIDPNSDLVRGTLHSITLSGVKATDGGVLAETTRSFTTEGRAPVVVPNADSQIAYWNFDGDANDAVGSFTADNVVDITYGEDRFALGNSTASFDGNTSIIEIAGADALMASDDFTLSFWIKTNTDGHLNADGNPANHFVMGLGAFFGFQFEIPADFGSCKLASSYVLEDGTKESEDLWFNGSGEDGMNGGWQGWDFVADLTGSGGVESILKDKWAHVICTYNAAEKQGRMYINGQLMKSQDFDLWPDGAPKRTVTGVSYRGDVLDVEPILAFGFIKSIDSPMWADTPWGDYNKPTANHFKGDLDDVRIFSAAFSAEDASSLYDSERP